MLHLDLSEAELKKTEEQILQDLRNKVRLELFRLTAECLGSHHMVILSAIGVDAEEKLLQIFLSEIKLLLNQP
jgi:hypothetical protein